VNALLGETISLIAGVVTGFVFERRGTRGVKESNEDLRRQISALKTSMLGLGVERSPNRNGAGTEDLTSRMTKRAMATQGPEGRVSRSALVAHFIEHDYTTREIDAVISSMCRAGLAREEGHWLQMT
jgi:hypothetical protein